MKNVIAVATLMINISANALNPIFNYGSFCVPNHVKSKDHTLANKITRKGHVPIPARLYAVLGKQFLILATRKKKQSRTTITTTREIKSIKIAAN